MHEQFQLNYWEEEGGSIMPQLKAKYRIFDGDYEFVYTTLGKINVYSPHSYNFICSFDPGPLDTQQDFEEAVSWFRFDNQEF